METLTTTLGLITDITCLLTVFVYMPLVNWWERKQRIAMKSNIPDDEWYELDMENH